MVQDLDPRTFLPKEESLCSAQAVANYFLQKARDAKKHLTSLQVLKLVYIAHGWTLAILEEPLFDDYVEAWQHGPVVPSLYHEFKHFGSGPIKSEAVLYDLDSGKTLTPRIVDPDQKVTPLLDKVWSVYKDFNGFQLRDLTHEPGSPWDRCYNANLRHIVIPNDLIRSYYQQAFIKMVGNVGK